jgi:hypothetical protein
LVLADVGARDSAELPHSVAEQEYLPGSGRP